MFGVLSCIWVIKPVKTIVQIHYLNMTEQFVNI